ncbi:MAG: hypothetical protein DRN99_06425 [Thermoproteota archaeon]|nr:MAG: hypothetical protein DRN99_06425 [Candidatus Korarchaeota archaeon]
MNKIKELEDRRREVLKRIEEARSLAERGVSWTIVQAKVEEYEAELRKIDREIASLVLGESELASLQAEKERIELRIKVLEQMYKMGEISKKVYKDKKRELEAELEDLERRIAEAKLAEI